MRFGLLGPVEVWDRAGRTAGIPAAKQRALLACLLLRANTPVGMDVLIDQLWDGAAPPSARTAVFNYLARLRRRLGPQAAARLRSEAGGYRLELPEPAEADHLHAAALERAAQQALARADWSAATALAGRALGLWRGEPLQDVTGDRLRAEHLPGLEALRLRLAELRIDAALGAGRFDRAVPWLQELTARHPLREPLQVRKLLALHGAGHRAEALADYHGFRGLLREELGVGPTRLLQEVHQLVLLDAAPAAVLETWRVAQRLPAGRAAGYRPLPRQLPRLPRRVVGRDAELAELRAILAGRAQVALLTGPAGVGKSTLALAWAHGAAGDFPDGQLHLDLGAHAPDGPLDEHDAVLVLLDCLGVPVDRRPATAAGRAALYRSTVADRRLLLVLDDARDAAQIRPLLPAGPSCRTVVTSRHPLDPLVALDGAEPLPLGALTPDGARELLLHRLGTDRTTGQEAALVALVERCGRLPLALAAVAAGAAARPQLSLEVLAADPGRLLSAETAHLRGLLGPAAAAPARDSAALLPTPSVAD
ncbi:AfsR/SARP family transcriptional regulator [Kitasatospora viridis]|uniref:DNA-binding SARP family transcriptional activator n=1 Tax=Kitasatospora viridis TaxID=281105 RepID=A0A561SFE7_9ACTN|nr:BTAD domain-containing putative transcriptional regulator [Kitasatospora viridis]TWF73591.1 DNA-binding SARP family transcriptional activator [Kitasatospora viridis]